MSADIHMISEAIKTKLAELVILLDQENNAGRANVATCVVMFDIPDIGIAMQVTGSDSKAHLVRMIRGLLMHTAGLEAEYRDEILPSKDRVN